MDFEEDLGENGVGGVNEIIASTFCPNLWIEDLVFNLILDKGMTIAFSSSYDFAQSVISTLVVTFYKFDFSLAYCGKCL